MQDKKNICKKNTDGNTFLKQDFRINISADFFRDLELVHLYSAAYEEPRSTHFSGGIETVINGYTEWVSESSPIVSIGWDWELRYENSICRYVKTGPAFTNIAFLLDEYEGLTEDEEVYTQMLIDHKISLIGWESKILQNITR
ncbi:DUF4902 domain-containing protein [Budvicia diplopodorum]|uniref:DUF4902 domain-containing protein n=1 Tax=Budvicia diplopodorum TaxID=1119056 RepID=UPI00135C6FF7|nr:DUF4902 domain-containing protein [Budvicia diplopodorum]